MRFAENRFAKPILEALMWQWLTVTALFVTLLHVFEITQEVANVERDLTGNTVELLN